MTYEEVWEIIKPEEGYVEIRILPIDDDWKYKKQLYTKLQKNKNIKNKNNIQYFITTQEELQQLMKDEWVVKNSKICYGVNERWEKDKTIDGSNESIRKIRYIYLDIEATDHGEITNQEMLDEYVEAVREEMKKYGLQYSSKIHSGVGRHLLYKIQPTTNTKGRREWIKEWVKTISKKLQTPKYKIDELADVTRVLGLPGSWNKKRGREVKIIQYEEKMNTKFRMKTKKEKKYKQKEVVVNNLPEVRESLEWKVLKNNAPKGERHTILIFALKLLMKAKGIEEVKKYEEELKKIYGGTPVLKPTYGTEGKTYNKGIIMNWCEKNKEWVKSIKEVREKYEEYKNENTKHRGDYTKEELLSAEIRGFE